MKVIIAGSRTITIYQVVLSAIEASGYTIDEVVSGGARGVDSLGELWGKARAVDIMIMPANWNTYGRAAGYIRNKRMANYADALLAVWDGKSTGTRHMITIMEELGKPVFKFIYMPPKLQ